MSAFNGVSLELTQSSNTKMNPELPEAHALYNWLQQNGLNSSVSLTVGGSDRGGGSMSFAQRKTISVIKDDNLGFSEKPDYLAFTATINYIKHDNDPWYTACPTEGCNKKVSEVTTTYAMAVVIGDRLRFTLSHRRWTGDGSARNATRRFLLVIGDTSSR